MKFIIGWLEIWDCYSDKEVADRLDTMPEGSKVTGHYEGVGVEFECEDTFEANSIKKLSKELEGYDCEVFTVYNENHIRLFIEEDEDLSSIELCPICYNQLCHFTINKEDVYGCYKCHKEVERSKAILLPDLIKQRSK